MPSRDATGNAVDTDAEKTGVAHGYEPPTLTVHGSIEQWTQGTVGPVNDVVVGAKTISLPAQAHSGASL